MRTELVGELLLLITAITWGFSFAFQRMGMRDIGPFEFNAVRAILAATLLLLFFAARQKFGKRIDLSNYSATLQQSIRGGIVVGLIYFVAVSFQQYGLVYATASHSGLITGLYVILVPILGMTVGRKTSLGVWIGALLAIGGIYFITGAGGGLSLQIGDWLTLVSAIGWALEILALDRFSRGADALLLTIILFYIVGALSLGVSLLVETPTVAAIGLAIVPILYTGVVTMSIGVICQAAGQQRAHPGRASIIISLMTLFGAVGGVLLLDEPFTWKIAIGGGLLLTGIITAQIEPRAAASDPIPAHDKSTR